MAIFSLEPSSSDTSLAKLVLSWLSWSRVCQGASSRRTPSRASRESENSEIRVQSEQAFASPEKRRAHSGLEARARDVPHNSKTEVAVALPSRSQIPTPHRNNRARRWPRDIGDRAAASPFAPRRSQSRRRSRQVGLALDRWLPVGSSSPASQFRHRAYPKPTAPERPFPWPCGSYCRWPITSRAIWRSAGTSPGEERKIVR